MRGDDISRAYSVCSAALSASSFDRSAFAVSSRRLSCRTATFTNTTPASRIPPIAIQRIPPRARACFARERPRGRTAGTGWAIVAAWACETLAIGAPSSDLRADAEARGLGAGVASHLGGARTDRPPRRRTQRRLRPADAHGEVGRARAPLLLPAQELLDDAVLQRVEGDDAEAPPRPQHLERCRERALERAELVVR